MIFRCGVCNDDLDPRAVEAICDPTLVVRMILRDNRAWFSSADETLHVCTATETDPNRYAGVPHPEDAGYS